MHRSDKHSRQKETPNHQGNQRASHRRPLPHRPRFILRTAPMHNARSIQAVHDPLRLRRRRRATDRSTRIWVLINPHAIRTTGLQNSLHITIWVLLLVQRYLVVIVDIRRQGRHRVARVVAVYGLGETRSIGVCHCGRFSMRLALSGSIRDATRFLAIVWLGTDSQSRGMESAILQVRVLCALGVEQGRDCQDFVSTKS